MENNLTDIHKSLPQAFSLPVTILIAIFAAFCIIMTVGGNCLVLAAFFVEKSLRTPTNYLIESLAITDLLIGLVSMSLFTMYVLMDNYWPLSTTICNLWLAIDYTACLTSQYTVFFITLDRFCSVKFPTKYREWRTKRIVFSVVIGTWILPGVLFFTVIFGWPHFNDEIVREPNKCYTEFMNHFYFNIILTFVYFWFTLIVMIGLYVGIYCVALRLQRKSYKRRLLTSSSKLQNYQIYDMNLETSNQNQRNSNTTTLPDIETLPVSKVQIAQTEDNEECNSKKGNRFKACRDSRKYHKKMSSTNYYFTTTTTNNSSDKTRASSHIQSEFHSAPAYDNETFIGKDKNKKSLAKRYVPESSESFYDEDESSCSSFNQERKSGQRSFIAPIAEAMTISARQKIFIPKTPKAPTMKNSPERHNNNNTNNNNEMNSPNQPFDIEHEGIIKDSENDNYSKKNSSLICFRNFFCTCECCFRNCNGRDYNSTRHSRGHSENRAIKALRTISLIMGAFLLCWTPYHILVMVKSFCDDCIPDWVFNISYWLCYMNSPINPFCYALANVQIKKTLIRLLKCDFRRT